MNTAINDLKRILLTEEQIYARVCELGAMISKDYGSKLGNERLLVVCMLKGAFAFMSDLVRNIDLHCEIDFMIASSYGGGTESSGIITIKQDVANIKGQHVLVVEDIVDSGHTMKHVMGILAARGPASLALCALLDKPERRVVPVDIAYCGFMIPDEFVVGYGLDYDSKYRNLPYIGVLKPEAY